MFRLKCYLVSALGFLAVAAFVLATWRWTMDLVLGMFPDQLAFQLVGFALWLVACNLVFFAFVRVLKCPACTTRFGWRHYFGDGHLFPSRTCPACGADMFAGKDTARPGDRLNPA